MDFTWGQILGALTTVIVSIVTGVPLFNFLKNAADQKKKERADRKALEITTAAELKKLQSSDRAQTNDELWQIIEAKNKECEKLERKIEVLEQTRSLPRPTMTKINTGMRAVSRQVENIRHLVERGEKSENLILEIDILEQKISELDLLLPW